MAEEQLRTLGVGDPVNDELDSLDSSKYAKASHLVSLWAGCTNSPADGSKAALHIQRYSPNANLAPTLARLSWALPSGNPDWRRLVNNWLRRVDSNTRFPADIALAFLNRFEQERVPAFLQDEWEMASTLALIAGTRTGHLDPRLAKYLAETLDEASKQGPVDTDEHGRLDSTDVNTSRAIRLCREWITRYPAGYQILLPATRAAAQRTIDRANSPAAKARLHKYYIDCFAEFERQS